MSMNQDSESQDKEGVNETRPSAEQPVPNTRAPEAGSTPAAGHVSPAEKSEPSGAIGQEQRHNADPNAPQTEVVPPGETQSPTSETGGVPLSSQRTSRPLGTDEARNAAQVPNTAVPPDAGEGFSEQKNDPNESTRDVT